MRGLSLYFLRFKYMQEISFSKPASPLMAGVESNGL